MAMDWAQPAPGMLVILFTDLEGSTRLWQQFPRAMQTVLARHDEIIQTCIEQANGRVVKSTGDGFHAVFENALDGIKACITCQKGLVSESWPETGPLHVRMGLHAGEAQARSGDYYGPAVNRAARLMSAANGGQILLSAAVAGMVAATLPEDASLKDLGEHRLKDLLSPEHIYQLVHSGLPADFPPIATLNLRPNNLPLQPSLFVGRESELHEINNRMNNESIRLLTLTGPGGTGKTRLALQSCAELSDRFFDGAYFIDLAQIRDPDAVAVSIARTLGLNESSNGSMMADLKEQLGNKQILLLLDNFEQVTAAGKQVADLLQYCPRLKMLATSREALHVRGEHLYPVPPLALPELDARLLDPQALLKFEAVQLFINRAQEVKHDFILSAENAEAIADICLRLDGLPLAIELAAARIRHLSPEALRQRLSSRLKLLRGGARDLPERQQTLRDTIDWSYDLLSKTEQTIFSSLSVFAGFTFEAAEVVVSSIPNDETGDLETFEVLESLIDKSLVRLVDDGKSEARLHMLETIREYAYERLQENSDRSEAMCRSHAVYFANFTHEQQKRLVDYDRDQARQLLVLEFENLQIAWQYWSRHGDFQQLQKMVDGLWLLYEGQGWYQGMVELTSDLLVVLEMTPSTPEYVQQEIMLRTTLGRALMSIRGFTPEVEETFKQALAVCEGQGEIPQLFPVLRALSSYYQFRADMEKCFEMGKRILSLAESLNDDFMRIHAYLVLGGTAGFIEGFEFGLKWLDKGIALFDPDRQRLRPFQIGNNPGVVCYTASALYLWWMGFADRAFQRAQKAVELAAYMDHPYTMTYVFFHTGLLYLMSGEFHRARKNALLMLEIATRQEYHLWSAMATILIGAIDISLGETKGGLVRLEEGFAGYMGHITPPIFWPDITGVRAAAHGRAGKPSIGIKLLDGLRETGDLTPDLLLLKGELLLQESPQNTAEASDLIRKSLDASQMMGNKIVALQAATKLANLEFLQRHEQDSGRILAELYGSFSEGFETADLKEAKETLEKLAGTY